MKKWLEPLTVTGGRVCSVALTTKDGEKVFTNFHSIQAISLD